MSFFQNYLSPYRKRSSVEDLTDVNINIKYIAQSQSDDVAPELGDNSLAATTEELSVEAQNSDGTLVENGSSFEGENEGSSEVEVNCPTSCWEVDANLDCVPKAAATNLVCRPDGMDVELDHCLFRDVGRFQAQFR